MGSCCNPLSASSGFTDAKSFSQRKQKKLQNSTSTNDDDTSEFVEGIKLSDEITRSFGLNNKHAQTFSKNSNCNLIRLICMLGAGSFAQVYLVRKEEDPCPTSGTTYFNYYAMKVLNKKLIREKEYSNFIKLEKRLTQNLRHPFILKLHYSFQCQSKLYLLLDFEGGGSLFYHLKKKRRFTEREVLFYAAEILLAIEYLHSKKILYRDLKPENVLINRDGHIKLADFGLSKHFEISKAKKSAMDQSLRITRDLDTADYLNSQNLEVDENSATQELTYEIAGTPQYMAPEIITEKGHNMAADWWAFGIVLYELATGDPPFNDANLEKLAEDICFEDMPLKKEFTRDFSDLILRLTHKLPKMRLGSCNK